MLKIPYFENDNSTLIPLTEIGNSQFVLTTKLDYVKLLKALNQWFKMNYSIGEDEYEQWLTKYTNIEAYTNYSHSNNTSPIPLKNIDIQSISSKVTHKSDKITLKKNKTKDTNFFLKNNKQITVVSNNKSDNYSIDTGSNDDTNYTGF